MIETIQSLPGSQIYLEFMISWIQRLRVQFLIPVFQFFITSQIIDIGTQLFNINFVIVREICDWCFDSVTVSYIKSNLFEYSTSTVLVPGLVLDFGSKIGKVIPGDDDTLESFSMKGFAQLAGAVVRPPSHPTSVLDMILNNLTVRLQ